MCQGVSTMNLPDSKKLILIPVLIAALSVGGYQAMAVYSVHDSKVYAEIVLQVQKVTEQINTINAQIELQKQHLYDLGWGKIEPYWSAMKQSQEDYKKLQGDVSGILSSAQDVEDSFKETFNTFDDFDPENESYAGLKNRMNQNRSRIEKLNRETIKLINHKQKELDESKARISKYQEMLKDVHGDKDAAQINALIAAENAYCQNLTNDIESLSAKLKVINEETKKLEADAAEKINDSVATDFQKSAKTLNDYADKKASVNTLSPKFEEYFKKKGWF